MSVKNSVGGLVVGAGETSLWAGNSRTGGKMVGSVENLLYVWQVPHLYEQP